MLENESTPRGCKGQGSSHAAQLERERERARGGLLTSNKPRGHTPSECSS